MTKQKQWLGSPIILCDLCLGLLTTPEGDFFIDGATNLGGWACMCVKCHKTYGKGLGQGRGQSYKAQPDGTWLKVEG